MLLVGEAISELKNMRSVFCLLLVLVISVIRAASDCSNLDFPCENGECIDAGLWCDNNKDCSDGSDEKYCKVSSQKDKDPNRCPSAYFKCEDGPCIPAVGRCNNYEDCFDGSDEKKCDSQSSNVEDEYPNTKSKGSIEESHSKDGFNENQHSGEIVYSNLHSSANYQQLEKARNWLLSQRKSDFGWGDRTPRVITALFLSGGQSTTMKNDSDFLMVKQLEVQLALNLARNGTQAMELSDLALYINALMASCKDPMNFYGDDLVRTLRNRVNAAHGSNQFVNPSVYLTLCMNNFSTYNDVIKVREVILSRNAAIGRMDIQALALLTTICLNRKAKVLNPAIYDDLKMQFLQRRNTSGLPGNVYEASLLMQALQELKVPIPELLPFILQRQQNDGSFGAILATYLALPVLAGRSFLQINDHCSQRYNTDPAPIEVLKNMKKRKISVKYALKTGDELTQTIEMKIAEGINFLDVMRLAQEVNPKYRFKLDGNRDAPVVYSIGGIPNDAEKGLFWTLFIISNSNRVPSEFGRLNLYPGNIKLLIPHPGDEFLFWLKSI